MGHDMKWVNPLSANPTKWSSVFDHFVGLALKGFTLLARVVF